MHAYDKGKKKKSAITKNIKHQLSTFKQIALTPVQCILVQSLCHQTAKTWTNV